MRKEDIFDRVVSVSWLGWFRPIYYKYREMWLYALFGLGTHQFICIFLIY